MEPFCAFLATSFGNYRSIVKAGASLYVCHSSSWQREFQNALEACRFEVRCQIIWAKNTFAWGFRRYKFRHEPIFYAHVAGQSDAWYGDKSAQHNGSFLASAEAGRNGFERRAAFSVEEEPAEIAGRVRETIDDEF
jgi:hypothetical protein